MDGDPIRYRRTVGLADCSNLDRLYQRRLTIAMREMGAAANAWKCKIPLARIRDGYPQRVSRAQA
jgi:hypothetical protein